MSKISDNDFDWDAYQQNSSNNTYRLRSSENEACKSFRDEVIKSTNHETEAKKKVDEYMNSLIMDLCEKNISMIKNLIKKQAEERDYKVNGNNRVIHGTVKMIGFINSGPGVLQGELSADIRKYATKEKYPGLRYVPDDYGTYIHLSVTPIVKRLKRNSSFWTGSLIVKNAYLMDKNGKFVLDVITEKLNKEGIAIKYSMAVDVKVKGKQQTHILHEYDVIEDYDACIYSPYIIITYDYTF